MVKKIIIILSFIIVIGGLSYLYQTVPMQKEIRMIEMINNQGKKVGIVKLSETTAGMLLALNISGLTPNGEHAFHIHQKADCSPIGTFKNAGGHFNPTDVSHGMQHPDGHHAGDMPNIKPNSKGVIKAQILNRAVTLSTTDSEDGRKTVFDEDGSAIMIHAEVDDHKSQPSGAAGARIICGEIK